MTSLWKPRWEEGDPIPELPDWMYPSSPGVFEAPPPTPGASPSLPDLASRPSPIQPSSLSFEFQAALYFFNESLRLLAAWENT